MSGHSGQRELTLENLTSQVTVELARCIEDQRRVEIILFLVHRRLSPTIRH